LNNAVIEKIFKGIKDNRRYGDIKDEGIYYFFISPISIISPSPLLNMEYIYGIHENMERS